MLDKIIEIIMTILPFLGNRKKRKAMAQDVKEFSELVKDQYTLQCVNKECLQRTQSEASISEA